MFFARALDFFSAIGYNNVVVGQLNLEKGMNGQRMAAETHQMNPFGQRGASTERKNKKKHI